MWFGGRLQSDTLVSCGNSKALVNYANVSYFTQNLFKFTRLSEAQIKLPKPVLSYVLVQCLTNL